MITVRTSSFIRCVYLVAALWMSLLALPGHAETLTGAALVSALRQGGYVIVMRHPSSPFAAPDKAHADPRNPQLERELDDLGRKSAHDMGEAFRSLHIPVGEILSSPTFRAREAVRLMGLGEAKTFPQLDEGAQGMKASADADRSAWLRKAVATPPRSNTNTLIVTHTPNLTGAFGQNAMGLAAGESLVFRPKKNAEPELVARLKIEDWPKLAASQ